MKSDFPMWTWKRLSWPMQIVVWLFVFYVAWNLIPAGYGKFGDLEGTAAFFATLGLPYGIMIATVVIEMIGPVLMAIPQISFYGAVPTFFVMVGASYHGDWNTVALTSAFLSLVVAVLTRPGMLRKKPTITTIEI